MYVLIEIINKIKTIKNKRHAREKLDMNNTFEETFIVIVRKSR